MNPPDESPDERPGSSNQHPRLLPGVAAVGLWMFFLCLLCLLGVSLHKLPHVFLLFCVAFALGGHGLLRLRRWGWALTLATVFLSALWGLWVLIHYHQMPLLVMILINAILFLYLIRPQVTTRLR
jgi:ABC-type uncharacterized transport system permease subunit